MAQKKKSTSGNPAKKVDPLADSVYRRLTSGVRLTKELQDHIAPMGDSRITLEQWRYLRGSVVCDLALYAHLTGKPSPIDLILASDREAEKVDF